MKFLLLSMSLLIFVGAKAQSPNVLDAKNKYRKQYAVFLVEENSTVFTDDVKENPDGSVEVGTDAAVIVSGNLTRIGGQSGGPVSIKVIGGPAEKTPSAGPNGTRWIKFCHNSNRWPCMLVSHE